MPGAPRDRRERPRRARAAQRSPATPYLYVAWRDPSAIAMGSFSGTVSGRALLARNPDGSCSFTQVPRLEVGKFAESGTLSF